MARIIKYPPDDWFDQWLCSGCKATIEFTKDDVRVGYSGMDNDRGYYAVCPSCKTQRHYDRSKLPVLVVHAADKKDVGGHFG